MTKFINGHIPGRLKPTVSFGQRVLAECSEDDVGGLSAELAYRLFLAIFPFFIFAAALGGLIANVSGADDPTGWTLDLIGDSLPEDAASVISGQVRQLVESPSGGLLTVGALGALWAASAGSATLIKAVNRCRDLPEDRNWFQKTGLALALTLGAGGGLLIAVAILLAFQVAAKDIAEGFGAGDGLATVFAVLRIPVAAFVLLAAIAFVFWLAPNRSLPFRFTPGALFATVAVLAVSVGLGFYISNFGSYNKTYGALGGVVVLMLWIYLVCFVILAGVKIDRVIEQDREASTLAASSTTMAVQAASAASLPSPARIAKPASGVPFLGYAILGVLVAAGVIAARRDA